MARPRTTRITEPTVADLREEFLDRCRAKNLSPRTMEWYEDRTRRFSDWCLERGILLTRDVTADDLEAFVLSLQAGPYKPQTVRGLAQVAKTIARYGHRKGLIPNDPTRGFEMPKGPRTIIQTFFDEQLEALLGQPDERRWKGLRDRGDPSHALGHDGSRLLAGWGERLECGPRAQDDPGDGKGQEGARSPLGKTATRALHRCNAVDGLRPDDPFFISPRGRRLDRSVITNMVADYGRAARITGVRCPPHSSRSHSSRSRRLVSREGDHATQVSERPPVPHLAHQPASVGMVRPPRRDRGGDSCMPCGNLVECARDARPARESSCFQQPNRLVHGERRHLDLGADLSPPYRPLAAFLLSPKRLQSRRYQPSQKPKDEH